MGANIVIGAEATRNPKEEKLGQIEDLVPDLTAKMAERLYR